MSVSETFIKNSVGTTLLTIAHRVGRDDRVPFAAGRAVAGG